MATVQDEPSQTVLLSLVGTAPAVLTETVWAMATAPEPVIPDRIIATTTRTGAQLLREKLFASGHWEGMKAALEAPGISLKGKLRFGPIADSIRVFPDLTHSRELDDIRSVEDNQAVAEFFMELIRGFTENESVRLIVSIAGGRKTTSALLYSVMTLLGRAQDQINHILINDEWISQPDFLYPGCPGCFVDRDTGEALSSADAQLQLVDVPFVPLRYLFKRDLQRPAGSFAELMNLVRTRTINVEDDLLVQLDTGRADLVVNGQRVSLNHNEFLLYLFFAQRAIAGQPPVEAYHLIGEDLRDLKAEHLRKDDFGHWSHRALGTQFDPTEDLRKWMSSIRRKLKSAGFDEFQIQRLVPRGGYLAIELPPENLSIDGAP